VETAAQREAVPASYRSFIRFAEPPFEEGDASPGK
jgi:hypothetical protein